MRNIKIVLEYDGTNYGGWQKQKDVKTVQGELEKAIFKITKEEVKTIGCSRTDSGVHSRHYVVNFNTESRVPSDRFTKALNTKLPDDIRVLESSEVSVDFHSRYHCIGKTYSYTLLNKEIASVMLRNYTWHIERELDINKMIEASKYLVGKHDFSSFRNTGSSALTTVRTITDISIKKEDFLLKIYISADGFLYNMARIIVGTLVQVGLGRIMPTDVEKILHLKDRRKAGKSAPPQGLCLENVFY